MDANGNMTVAGTVSGGTPMSGMRNRLINGAFDIWQRGTSVAYRTGGGNSQFLADRWGIHLFQDGRHQRVSVTSPPSGLTSRYALRASSSTTSENAGGTRIDVNQTIENLNCYDLAGKTVTLSFWVKFSAATISSSTATAYGNFNYNIGYYTTSTDGASFTTYTDSAVGGFITNGSLPTTWTKYTYTTTVPAGTNNISVIFQFTGLGSTASADTAFFDVTQVQLEEGSIATPFERRPFGMELSLCQRYFNKSMAYATPISSTSFSNASDSFSGGITAYATNAGYMSFPVFFPVQMRVAPSLTVYTTSVTGNAVAGKIDYYNGSWNASNTIGSPEVLTDKCFRLNPSGSWSANQGILCYGAYIASAEL